MTKSTTNKHICITCGTQFPPDEALPGLCPICNDDRQYVNPNGQTWISTDELINTHGVTIAKINERLYTFKITPNFGITQRAFFILSPKGNVLWDCIPLLNEQVVAFIKAKGGLKAIAFSHPHYYSNMSDWAAKFNCPVYIHQLDEEWISYKPATLKLWSGDKMLLWDNISLIHIGGHFPGSCVLHLTEEPEKGTILCGDTFYIAPSNRHIAVMYSYPNQLLLSKSKFLGVYKRSSTLKFDTMYGAFERQNLVQNAGSVFAASMQRYIDDYNS